jgi:CoA binding protein
MLLILPGKLQPLRGQHQRDQRLPLGARPAASRRSRRDRVPAVAVLDVVDDCRAGQVKSVVVITAAFAEVGGEGRALQAQLLAKVRSHGMRMVGPNCMGLLNTAIRLNASFMDSPRTRRARGKVANPPIEFCRGSSTKILSQQQDSGVDAPLGAPPPALHQHLFVRAAWAVFHNAVVR